MTICGAAFSSSVAVSPVSGSSEETSCQKVTCGVPPAASFCSVSVETEVFSQVVVAFTCEAGKTVTGLVGGSGTFERGYESRRDLAPVGSDAESYQTVSCDTISLVDAPHTAIPMSSFMSHQSALVTCDLDYSTDMINCQADSYSVFFESSDTLSGLEAVQHARSREGTPFGESCTVTDDEEFTLTGLGGDVNKQTLEVCGDRALRKLEGVQEN